MENLKEIKSLIFDIDGTIWDSTENVAKAFNSILKHEPTLKDQPPVTAEILKSEFGKPLTDIGRSLFPTLQDNELKSLLKKLLSQENAYLEAHQFETYAGLVDTLKKLSLTHRLFIVSNCQSGYIELCLKNTGLDSCIIDHLCPGDTGVFKAENIRLLMERHQLDSAIYIGDTELDQKASHSAGIPFIWAAYGFGHASKPDAVIQKPEDLLTLLF